jgi:hypothetical protein
VFDLPVSDTVCELGHGVGANVTAVRHEGCQRCANVFGFPIVVLRWERKVTREPQLVVHLN